MRYLTGEETPQPSILVLRALGLGDLATAVPALRAIRRGFPAHRVVLATSPSLEPLVDGMDFVDVMLARESLTALPLQFGDHDVAVNLHGRGPESTLALLEATPRRLIAFAHPDIPSTFGFPRWRRREHEVARWCRLLDESGIGADPADIRLDPPRRETREWESATVIHPGASSVARQWPPDRWAVVARSLASEGDRVVITGDASELALAHEIAREAGLSADAILAGRTDVADLAAVVGLAGRLVSSDTGPAHLATAYGTPSVTLFGPTSPEEWGPPPSDRHVALWKGSRGPANADAPDDGLLAITVDEVLAAIDRLQRPWAAAQASAARLAATFRSPTS